MRMPKFLARWALRSLDYNPSLFGSWIGGSVSKSGELVNPDTAITIAAVYACLRIIAGTLATVPLRVRRVDGDYSYPANDYFLHGLLRRPNEEQTALEFKDMLQGHLLLRGNAYCAIDRNRGGMPARLVPLHPDRVRPDRLPDGTLVYHWTPNNQPVRDFYPKLGEIMHLRIGLSRDGIRGAGIIECARESMGMALALEEYGARLFQHGAAFSGMLKYDGILKDEKLQSLRKDFAEKYSGIQNAFKPLILEKGMDWVSIGMNAHDAEFLLSRKFSRAEIASWFLVPPHMIGDVERSTSWGTGIEQQSIGFHQYTMIYWYTLWEQALERDLIPQKDQESISAKFSIEGILRGDIKTRYSSYAIGRQYEWLSANDVRRAEGMNPIGPDGDKYQNPSTSSGKKSDSGDVGDAAAGADAGENPSQDTESSDVTVVN